MVRQSWHRFEGLQTGAAQYNSATLSGQNQAAYGNFVSAPDPTSYLLAFQLEEALGMFWRPARFGTLLEDALGTVDHAARLRKLADADRMIMKGMPLIPLIFESADYMRKPDVRGLPMNVSSMYRVKYAWVETQ